MTQNPPALTTNLIVRAGPSAISGPARSVLSMLWHSGSSLNIGWWKMRRKNRSTASPRSTRWWMIRTSSVSWKTYWTKMGVVSGGSNRHLSKFALAPGAKSGCPDTRLISPESSATLNITVPMIRAARASGGYLKLVKSGWMLANQVGVSCAFATRANRNSGTSLVPTSPQ